MKLRWMMVAAGLFAFGCGKVADEETQGPPLATMRGTLSLAEGMDPPEGELRLSILWTGDQDLDKSDAGAACGPGEVTSYRDETPLFEQRLELDTDFPAAFSAALSEPPPSGALMSLDQISSDVKIALGELIVYRDANGNGRLDQHGFDEPASPDQVLGSGKGTQPRDYAQRNWYQVEYLTGDLHSSPNHFIAGATQAGYSLSFFEVTEEGGDEEETRPLDGKVEIELALDATKYVQRWTCRDTCRIEGACPEDPADLPPVQERGTRSTDDGSWHWQHTDGDKAIDISAACLRGRAGDDSSGPVHEVYKVSMTAEENCTTTQSECLYERGKLPDGVDIPCTEFLEPVAFPNGFFK